MNKMIVQRREHGKYGQWITFKVCDSEHEARQLKVQSNIQGYAARVIVEGSAAAID